MGFHLRGWFGAWMAGEGGSAASRARQPWQWWLGRSSLAQGAGLGFYRRMGVTGGRFPSPGRQCGAGGVRNRGSRSPAALAHGGVSWRLSELARARGELGWCQGEAAWGRPGQGRRRRGGGATRRRRRRVTQGRRRGAWRAEKKPGRSCFGSTRGRGVVLAGGATCGRSGGTGGVWRRRGQGAGRQGREMEAVAVL